MDFGHLKIRDDDLDRVSTVFPQSFFTVFSEEDLVAFSFEDGAQDEPICFVVIDDENACHAGEPQVVSVAALEVPLMIRRHRLSIQVSKIASEA